MPKTYKFYLLILVILFVMFKLKIDYDLIPIVFASSLVVGGHFIRKWEKHHISAK